MINIEKIEGKVLYNESLARYNWFGVGGCAEILFKPSNTNDLQNFLQNLDKNLPITMIGGGSNLLIRDNGIKGVVIVIKDTFKKIKYENNILEVECGISNLELFNFLKKNKISGYEFLATIPGTLGGAIRGNAGCYGSEIKDFLISLETIDFNGNIKTFSNQECNFEYRKNNLPDNLIFTKAILKCDIKKEQEEIENIYNEMIAKRNNSQPQGVKTAGSTFKNLPDMPAWKAIQEIGYQNKEIDGAKMSEKHANFMVNTGTATASSLENLALTIQKLAKEKLNVDLELEIKILGE